MTSIPDSPGKRLREAREALGKSTSELAAKTRIKVQQLEGLESDHYESIPAPMYVRGFLKLYAQELGLDPEPLLEAYKQSGQDTTPERRITRKPPDPVQDSSTPEPRPEKGPRKSSRPIFATTAPLEDSYDQDDEKSQRVKDTFNQILNTLLDADWWTGSWVPRIAGGILAIGLLTLILVNSLSGTNDPVEDPTPAAGTEETVQVDLPELENPLIQAPAPLYFELPRTLE